MLVKVRHFFLLGFGSYGSQKHCSTTLVFEVANNRLYLFNNTKIILFGKIIQLSVKMFETLELAE